VAVGGKERGGRYAPIRVVFGVPNVTHRISAGSLREDMGGHAVNPHKLSNVMKIARF
jgi:hypothetical protein